MEIKKWRHVFKVDPAKEITDEALELLAESGTDAILVGGSDGVTLDNVLDLLVRVRRYSVPLALEVSTVDSLTPGYDYYFIPTVLNTADAKWINGFHHEAIREYGHMMDWDEIIPEGYCIMNPSCKAAILTGANEKPDVEDVIAYARMAEHMFKLPIFYLEYSGQYGDVEIVQEAANILNNTQLFYGGGITSVDQAKEMASVAQTVVVGNIIYDDLKAALATVKAVASVALPRKVSV